MKRKILIAGLLVIAIAMGFFRDLKKLSDKSREFEAQQPRAKDRMAQGTASMAAMNEMMAQMNAALSIHSLGPSTLAHDAYNHSEAYFALAACLAAARKRYSCASAG